MRIRNIDSMTAGTIRHLPAYKLHKILSRNFDYLQPMLLHFGLQQTVPVTLLSLEYNLVKYRLLFIKKG
jgi:hypothetical protein